MKFPLDRKITFREFKIERGSLHSVDNCNHRNLQYDISSRIIYCKDCEREIDHFDAFFMIVKMFAYAEHSLDCRREELDELEKRHQVGLLKATRKVDEAWRSRSMVPICPHCHKAIFPTDGFGGNLTNKDLELERRRFKPKGGSNG